MAKHTTEELDGYLRTRVMQVASDQQGLEDEIQRLEERAVWLQGQADSLEATSPKPGSQAERDLQGFKREISKVLASKTELEQQLARTVDEIECLADLRELALPGTSQPVAVNAGSD